MRYDVGDSTVLTATFTDDGGALADPTQVGLSITEPDGTVTAYGHPAVGGVQHLSLGQYEFPVTLDLAGVWTYTWTGTGTVEQTETGHLVVATAARSGPCKPWVSAADVFGCGDIADADKDFGLAGRVAWAASEVLFQLSGRQFSGLCRDVVRPCRRVAHYDTDPSWAAWLPGGWGQSPWGVCACQSEPHRSCGCGSLDEVTLGGYPVVGVESVYVDGVLLDPSAYRVDDRQYLVRVDGDGWPCCQDLRADPTTDDNTFQVTFFYGQDVPQAGVEAARTLAYELYLACTGGECQLPQRVQTISRQGVTAVMLDPFTFLDKGKVGLYEVDLFLMAYNPHGRRRRASITSPDVGRRVRRAGT